MTEKETGEGETRNGEKKELTNEKHNAIDQYLLSGDEKVRKIILMYHVYTVSLKSQNTVLLTDAYVT